MMRKIKSLPLWQKIALSALVVVLAAVGVFYVVACQMAPYVYTATLTVAPENIPEGTDLVAKPVTTLYKSTIKRISAGRPASGNTLTAMFIEVYGEEALVCPHCKAALPTDVDLSKKFACSSCAKEITNNDMAQPFKDAMVKVTNFLTLSGETGIVFTCQGNDQGATERMLAMLMRESEYALAQDAAKAYPNREEPIANEVSEIRFVLNTSPRTYIFAVLAAIAAGMVCFMIFTSDEPSLAFRKLLAYSLLVVLTILCIIFFYILFINATRAHSDIQSRFSFVPGKHFVQNWHGLMGQEELPVWRGMFNSLVVSASVAVLSTYFSVLTAYAIHAYQFKLRNFAFKFILLVMMVPGQVSALGFVEMMNDWSWNNTFWPLIIPSIAAPTVFFFMKQYMDSALPLAIVEAARIDGSSEFGTFNRIVIHIMKPAIAVQAIFSFVGSWNNYFTPALLLNKKEMKTLPILIAQLRSADYLKFDEGQVYMMICLSILPVIVVYLCLSKLIIAGVCVGGVKE